MSNKNLPVKKGKKSNIFKRGVSAFLAFIGISNAAYAQAKTIDDYKDDYNTNSGYTEKTNESIDAKYNKVFENIGIVVDDISDKNIEDRIVDKDISDKIIEDKTSDKAISDKEIEDKIVDKDISDKGIEDKTSDKTILDKEIEDKMVDKDISDKDIEDKNNPMMVELTAAVNNDDLLQYIGDKDVEDKGIYDKDIEDKGI